MKNNVVDVICEAWRSKNIGLLDSILSSEFEWRESPFADLITDKDKLYDVWRSDISCQENIRVDYEILSETDFRCIARWRATYEKNNVLSKLDGIFVIGLDSDGKLNDFCMWWVAD